VQRLLRKLAPQVLGALYRRFGHFGEAEDAMQEALLAAALQWPREGIPESPRAWVLHVAGRKMTDHVRTEAARRKREGLVVSLVPPEEQVALPPDEDAPEYDDTLDLLFSCCHPSLSTASAIALTLRAVGGLTTLEIARAFLVPEATMAQRISRAKETIRASGMPLSVPEGGERASRVAAVTHVLYLIFSEGYTASSGAELQRVDLSSDSIRLARMLRRLVPEDAEVTGLLALMVLTDARRHARTGPSGELIPLDEQDRGLWDRVAIEEGVGLVNQAMQRGALGSYQVQAAIAAVHDQASRAEDTDWEEILGLYGLLMRLSDSPVVALNHAVAFAMVRGPVAGLERLDELAADARLQGSHRLEAARAHLLERAGRHEEAADAYRRAAERTTSVPERDYLLSRVGRPRSP
jgi:RNA polymerase sigma factor (sigma-70 family)